MKDETTLFSLWKGPIPLKDVWNEINDENYCLYQLYGRHVVYGPDALLYIGRCGCAETRIGQHMSWLEWEQDRITVYLATLGVFQGWTDSSDELIGAKPREPEIAAAEALLIHTHCPSYNSQHLSQPKDEPKVRIFNVGQYGSLAAETSTLRWS